MATLERTYIIPLRREWLKAQKYKRAKKAVRGVKDFLMRHMKVDLEMVKLGTKLNEEIWKHGMKNPPSRVKVNVVKDDKNLVTAELFGFEMPKKKEEKKKKEERTGIAAKLADKIIGKEKKPEAKLGSSQASSEAKRAALPAEPKRTEEKKPETKPAEEKKPAEKKPAAKPVEKKV